MQEITLVNDGDVAWPKDCALYIVKKSNYVSVLDEIWIGKVNPNFSTQVSIEIFAFSTCSNIEYIEFELRHNQGTHAIGSSIVMQFKMV